MLNELTTGMSRSAFSAPACKCPLGAAHWEVKMRQFSFSMVKVTYNYFSLLQHRPAFVILTGSC